MTEAVHRLSEERLMEILAATEGVTPGPWKQAGFMVGGDNRRTIVHTGIIGNPPSYAKTSEANAAHIANCDPQTIAALVTEVLAAREALAKYEEAVTPSGDTKAAYIAEFTFPLEQWDPNAGEDGEGGLVLEDVTVPWTTIKEIMAAIKARAITKSETTDAA